MVAARGSDHFYLASATLIKPVEEGHDLCADAESIRGEGRVAGAGGDAVVIGPEDGVVVISRSLNIHEGVKRIGLGCGGCAVGLLFGLEIHQASKVFSALENVRDGIIRPTAFMTGMLAPCAAGSAKFDRSGRWDFLRGQYPGNSGWTVACQTQTVYLLDNRGDFLIYNEITVFAHEVAVHWLAGGGLSTHTFGSLRRPDFLAGVPNKPLIEQVPQRCQVVLPIGAVHGVIDGNEADAFLWENHFRVHSHLKIVSTKSRHIFLCQVGTKKILRIYKSFIGGQPPVNGLYVN